MLPKFLTVDPGEDTGWSVWEDGQLVDAGTTKMWDFSDAVWAVALWHAFGDIAQVGPREDMHKMFDLLPDDLQEVAESLRGIELLVTENWTLYPWEAMAGNLNWDECRTARLIGSLYQACRVAGWTYEQQGAKIKERAMAAGAEHYFSHPLRENRHANDAIMHGVFRNALDRGAAWTDLSQTSWNA